MAGFPWIVWPPSLPAPRRTGKEHIKKYAYVHPDRLWPDGGTRHEGIDRVVPTPVEANHLREVLLEQEQRRDRLYFATIETAAGSKSQGWHGILYAEDGVPVILAPGEDVETFETTGGLPFKRFVGVAAKEAWYPYGAIPDVLIQGGNVANNVMDGWWHYQIWVEAEGTRSAATSGVLILDGKVVRPDTPNTTIKTAMGDFAWVENDTAYGAHGWYPK
jgi:hypothetical protein